MPKIVACSKCGMKMGIPDNAAGQSIQCPTCKAIFKVTVGGTAPSPAPKRDPGAASITKPPPLPDIKKKPAPPAPPPPRTAPKENNDFIFNEGDDAKTRSRGRRYEEDDEHSGRRRERDENHDYGPARSRQRGGSKTLLWVLVSVGLLALVAGGGFLVWYLNQRPLTPEEQLALELKKQLQNLNNNDPFKDFNPKDAFKDFAKEAFKDFKGFPKDFAVPDPRDKATSKETEPRPKKEEPKKEEPKKEEPKKEEPKKELPKIELPKIDQPKKEDPKQVPPPKDTVVAAGDGWHEVHCLQGRFHVTMPAAPVFRQQEQTNQDYTSPTYTAKHPKEDLVFEASSYQYGGIAAGPIAQGHLLNVVVRLLPKTLYSFKKEVNVKHDGLGAREFVAEGGDKKKVVGRHFQLDDVPGRPRVFTFTVTGPEASLEAPDVQKFLNSVKIEKGELFLAKRGGLDVGAGNDKPHYVLKGNDSMEGAIFTKDGKTLFTAWRDGVIKTWDTASMTEKPMLPPLEKTKNIRGIALSPDEKTLAAFSNSNVIELVDLASRKSRFIEDAKVNGAEFGIAEVHFSPDGKFLGVLTGLVAISKVFDLETLKVVSPDLGHSGKSMAYSPDGSVLVISSQSNSVTMVDAATYKGVATLPARGQGDFSMATHRSLAFAPDSKRFAVGWEGEEVHIWNVKAKKQRPMIKPQTGGYVGPLAFNSKGDLLAVSTSKGVVQLWDVPTVTRLATLASVESVFTPRVLTISPDDKKLLVTDSNKAYVWDLDRVTLDKVDLAKAVPDPEPDSVVVAKKDPDKKDPGPDKKNPDPKNPDPKNPAGPAVAGEVGKLAGKLTPFLGAVVDVDAKAALLLVPGAQAKLYGYPDFKLLGTYKLAAGTAYRAVCDKAKGRLFVLSPNFKAKDPAGKAGGSQVVIYDIRDLLDGKVKTKSELAPAKSIQLPGFCTQLCVSPDGEWLYALETKNPKALKVVRVSAADGEAGGSVAVPEFTDGLVLASDGTTLYALAHLSPRLPKGPPSQGAILVIDPEAMKLKKTINVAVDPFDMAVTKEGIVFVTGYGGVRSEITVVDVEKDTAVIATWKGIPTSSCLKLSADEKCLYVGSWKSGPGTVAVLPLPAALAGSELPKAQWAQAPSAPTARGEMVVAPDNRFLLCDSGFVFTLQAAQQAGGGARAWIGAP
jgi:DNA-binding beta-propeller fold protein YncE